MTPRGSRIAVLIEDGFDDDVDRPVVEDRGVITARKADAVAGFMDAVLQAIDRAAMRAGDDTIA